MLCGWRCGVTLNTGINPPWSTKTTTHAGAQKCHVVPSLHRKPLRADTALRDAAAMHYSSFLNMDSPLRWWKHMMVRLVSGWTHLQGFCLSCSWTIFTRSCSLCWWCRWEITQWGSPPHSSSSACILQSLAHHYSPPTGYELFNSQTSTGERREKTQELPDCLLLVFLLVSPSSSFSSSLWLSLTPPCTIVTLAQGGQRRGGSLLQSCVCAAYPRGFWL